MKKLLIAAFVALGIAGQLTGGTRADESRELTVFAAASLRESFEDLAKVFETKTPGVKVRLNLAGSQELRTQIEHGAAADVMASADGKHMDALLAQGLVVAPAVFTCNEPVVVVRAALAPAIKTLADLPRAERIVIGVPDVPIGAYTLQILKKAAAKYGADFPKRVEAKVASRELNVRQVLAKVALGEADAGFVYSTDAKTVPGQVIALKVPAWAQPKVQYGMCIVSSSQNKQAAQAFVNKVVGKAGQAKLLAAGFLPRVKPPANR